MRLLFDRFKHRSGLLLMLAVALVGFFLLINLLGSVTSSGPDDLLATAPSEESFIRLPNGVGMFAFAVGSVGVVLGAATVFGFVVLARRNAGAQSRRYLVIGAVVGLLLAGGGLYLAFSGVLGQDIGYGEHQAQRSFVQPKGLVIVGAFFLSLVLVGMLKPRLILAHLAVWLVLSLIFGFFGSASLAGLNLFEETEEPLSQEAYAAEVEKYRQPRPKPAVVETVSWDAEVPLENGNSALVRGSSLLLQPGTSAVSSTGSVPNPLFTVTGAANTTRLRSATGDVYENGKWLQLDASVLPTDTWSDIPRGILDMIDAGVVNESLIEQGLNPLLAADRVIPDLLAQPSAVPDSLNIDHISVSPAGGFNSLEPGTLPISALPLGIKEEGTWNPFSRTFSSDRAVSGYEWQSMAVEFLEDALANAEAVDDPTYYQLPENLPLRVRTLASDITQGLDSPYLKTKAIEQYLKSEYSYTSLDGDQVPLQPPAGEDPVDWFLFDQKSGGSTSFSSAFSILARASGVPARVVSGWAIRPTAEEQTVYGDQSHQWAEVGLKEFGWIPFDPTPGIISPAYPGEEGEEGLAEEPTVRQHSRDGTATLDDGPQESSPVRNEELDFREEIALQNLSDALDPDLRREAAGVLGEIGSEGAIRGLSHSIFNDTDPSVRDAAVTSMTSLEFEVLVEILEEHPQSLLRRAAAISLGEKGDQRALNPLGGALARSPDTDEDVRAAAASALGELLKPEAVDPLLYALASDEAAKVRAASAAALGELGDTGVAIFLKEALIQDPGEDVRASAADALGDLLNPESLPQLIESRSIDPSSRVRGACAEAVARFTQSGLAQAMAEHLDSSVRASAAQVLGERGNPSAADELVQALQDPDSLVREAAGTALENLGDLSSLENGSGLLSHAQGVSFIPGATAEQAIEIPHTPVFQLEVHGSIAFLRTAVGDQYQDGAWFTDGQTKVAYQRESALPQRGPPTEATAAPVNTQSNRVWVQPIEGERWIPAGVIPISAHPTRISLPGTYYPDSGTFASDNSTAAYDWTSNAPVYSQEQLNSATASHYYQHVSLPDGIPSRVAPLAEQIVAGHSSPYQKAKAIEQHLRSNYAYQLADPTGGEKPAGSDPVDWFLFEGKKGTCGNFSSAFVALARSVGLPARVVSGWSIAPAEGTKTVYSDQAHQRAEVAFEGLGWIPFEPTPTSGAPGRASGYSSGNGVGSKQEQQEIEQLVQQLSSNNPGEQASASEGLESLGVEVSQTENGGAVVSRNGQGFGLGVGTTTRQVEDPNGTEGPRPVLIVSGAAHTSYLRSATGDVYQNGVWRQIDQVYVDYDSQQSIPHLVKDEISEAGGPASFLPESLSDAGLLAGFEAKPPIALTDNIVLEASPELGSLPAGVVPTSQFLDRVDTDGIFRPISGMFSLDAPTQRFSWVSQVPVFSREQLEAAIVVSDPAYTELPNSVPERVRALALEITQGYGSPYAKAKALESYLRSEYTYRFADGTGSESPPAGRDPVDWFLFDHREGTCGVFSTSFVVMARSIGIPSRVASGWAISATSQSQEVMSDQAHQWAEVAFKELGWVQFEPTASSGAPSRTALAREATLQVDPQNRENNQLDQPEEGDRETPSVSEEDSEQISLAEGSISEEQDENGQHLSQGNAQPAQALDTVTTINSSPSRVRRKTSFTVAGTLRTTSGSQISEMQVEIFINETKEHGGTKIGETTARNGNFRTEVSLPSSMERGPYQLLAHAIGNEQYAGSWSDPDVTVYSESGLQLTGPTEVAVDTQAQFRGKLLDDTGSGVANLELQVAVDGRDLPLQSTNETGKFAFAQTFAEIGSHTVEVGFGGKEFLLGNAARLELTAVMPTELHLDVLGKVKVGEEFLIEGFLRNVRGEPVQGAHLKILVGHEPPWEVETLENGMTVYTRILSEGRFDELSVITGDDGRFATTGTAQTVGETLVRAEFAGQYPVLPTNQSTTVTARHLTEMTISGPSTLLQGEEAIFQGRIASKSLQEIGSLEISIHDRQGNLIDNFATEDDGSFEYRSTDFVGTGPRLITARFDEEEHLTSSSASLSFSVVAPTFLSVEGPSLVPEGSTVELRGNLRTSDGEPVPGAFVWVGDSDSQPLITGSDGSFGREFPLTADIDGPELEETVNIAFGFDGTDRLAPSLRNHSITVGVPWLSVEPTEEVARGETATLRGSVMLGSYPIPNAVVTAEPGGRTVSGDTGSFNLTYPIPSDTPLGRNEVSVSVAELDIQATVPINVKSSVNIVVVPLEDVRPGEDVPMQVTLLDDRDNGIPGANLETSQDHESLTNNVGTALLTLSVPEAEELEVVPITFTYEGDDFHMPLSYFAGIPVTPAEFNWLLWVGLPALVVAVVASGFLASRGRALAFPTGLPLRLKRRRGNQETLESNGPASTAVEEPEPEPEPEPVPDPEPTLLAVTLKKVAEDLPDVWGLSEQVSVSISLSTEEGVAVGQARIEVHGPAEGHLSLVTADDGDSTFAWEASQIGEFTVSAEYEVTALYLASSGAANFRVVNFREEIVRLYNDFVAWTEEQVSGASGRTPRELEALLVGSGMNLDFRAVDEIVSRFEEADYSEHPIGRRQYESMYRSWKVVAGE